MRRSSYRWTVVKQVILVVDNDYGDKSVTNDAEEVCRDFIGRGLLPGKQLIYRDSIGSWSEMIVDDHGNFRDFAFSVKPETQVILDRFYDDCREEWSQN